MLILFDHGTPKGLTRALIGHTIITAQARGWDKLNNSELRRRHGRQGELPRRPQRHACAGCVSDFGGSVSGFSSTDALDLFDIGFGAGGTRGYSGNGDNSGGTLSMSDGTNTANIALISNYTASATAAR